MNTPVNNRLEMIPRMGITLSTAWASATTRRHADQRPEVGLEQLPGPPDGIADQQLRRPRNQVGRVRLGIHRPGGRGGGHRRGWRGSEKPGEIRNFSERLPFRAALAFDPGLAVGPSGRDPALHLISRHGTVFFAICADDREHAATKTRRIESTETIRRYAPSLLNWPSPGQLSCRSRRRIPVQPGSPAARRGRASFRRDSPTRADFPWPRP